jgi:hypothetical protein
VLSVMEAETEWDTGAACRPTGLGADGGSPGYGPARWAGLIP